MIFNKKYFLTMLTIFGIQLGFGVTFANAVCDNEIRVQCSEETKLPPGGRDKFCDEGKNK